MINSYMWSKGVDKRRRMEMLGMILDVYTPTKHMQIEDHMEFISLPFEHEHGPAGVRNSPLMKNYYKNTDAAKGIALAEYVAITYLLHQ